MTEAGLTLVRAWCDKCRVQALLDAAPSGRGAMSTLRADGGTWAFCKVCSTWRGSRVWVCAAGAMRTVSWAVWAWAGHASVVLKASASESDTPGEELHVRNTGSAGKTNRLESLNKGGVWMQGNLIV